MKSDVVSWDDWEDDGVTEFEVMRSRVGKAGCYKIPWVAAPDLNYFTFGQTDFLGETIDGLDVS